jgi:hypothetical protein
MSHFPAPVSEPVHEDWTRVLVEDWEWTFRMYETEYRIFVPAGVRYEPSIPTPAEGAIPADRLEPASLPHDVIYKLKGRLDRPDYDVLASRWQGEWHRRPTVSRKYADDLFRLILQELGVASWRTWLAYKAVRWFGRPAWNEEDDFTLPEQIIKDNG